MQPVCFHLAPSTEYKNSPGMINWATTCPGQLQKHYHLQGVEANKNVKVFHFCKHPPLSPARSNLLTIWTSITPRWRRIRWAKKWDDPIFLNTTSDRTKCLIKKIGSWHICEILKNSNETMQQKNRMIRYFDFITNEILIMKISDRVH